MDGWEASHQIRKVQGPAQIDEINAMVARYLGFVQTVRQVALKFQLDAIGSFLESRGQYFLRLHFICLWTKLMK